MKILYAASNNLNAKIQLSRFLKAMDGSKHQIKIAAYKISSPKDVNIDWTLDALLNIYKPDLLSLHNDNLNIYFEQIKNFQPDLVISDLEYFTSYVSSDLNLPLWQCSSSTINYALTRQEKYGLGLFKYHAHSLNRDTFHTQRTVNIIDNSNRNFVYSHYGDVERPPVLERGFEWIRPYSRVSKEYVPCQHYVTAGLLTADKIVLDVLKKYPDTVAFVENPQERHDNVQIKDIRIEDEYYCNLRNSIAFVCRGQASFLADAFYNSKYALIYPNFDDAESVTNSQLSSKFGTGRILSYVDELIPETLPKVNPIFSSSVKYLHEHIEEL